ncbi:MAG TPA: ABC transporter substrate-binding protein, partial [Candidatus Acidoferrales bacterium]|nr:ABC transporter substrate-binding protein [Candidatus Acidoferrales bacterium]
APAPAATAAPASATVAAAADAGPLVIGVLLPYTESAIDGDIGASQRRAADLYLKLHGGKLGGRDARLVWNDESALDPATNQVRVKQFLDKDHAQLLLGGAGGAAAQLLRDTAEAQKLVYLDTNSTARFSKSAYAFHVAPTAWQLSEPLGEWAAKNRAKEFYAAYADEASGAEAAAAFAEGLAKNGGRLTAKAAVPAKSADWTKVVAAIKAQPTKDVFAAFYTEDAAGLIGAWSNADLRGAGYRLYGPGSLADYEVLKVTKEAALGTVTSYPWSVDAAGTDNSSLINAFKGAYKDEDTGQPLVPDGYAVEMWDALLALDTALAVTKGDATAAALVPALEGASFMTPAGPAAVDKATHTLVTDVYIREVRTSGGGNGLLSVSTDRVSAVRDPGN